MKVNQLENELEHHFKRLDIICKSKGLPRPIKKFNTTYASSNRGSSYISPYRRAVGTNSNNGSATRNKPGINSSAKRPSPGYSRPGVGGNNYTPPNKRAVASSYSPVGS